MSLKADISRFFVHLQQLEEGVGLGVEAEAGELSLEKGAAIF